MAAHHVSAFRLFAEDPLLSDGNDNNEVPIIHYFKRVEAHLISSKSGSAESYPGYDREHSPSDDLSYYIPLEPSVANEHAPPPQSS